MDEEEIEVVEPGRGGSLLPVIAVLLGLLGIGVGGTGLYFGYNATERLTEVETILEDELGQVSESRETLHSSLETLTADFQDLESNLSAIKSRMRIDRNAQEDSLKEVFQAISTNRKQINQNSKDIAAIPEQVIVEEPEPPEPRSRDEKRSSEDRNSQNSDTDASGNTVHTIEAGDYFGKLAREYDVPLSSIMKANPSVNPNALQIGQKVVIPKQ